MNKRTEASFTRMVQLSNRAFARRREIAKGNVFQHRPSLTSAEAVGDESWHAVFQTIPAPILIGDMNGNLLATNDAGSRLLGYDAAELRQLTVIDVVAAPDTWTISEFDRFKRNLAWEGEIELRRKDHSTRQAEATVVSTHVSSRDIFLAHFQEGARGEHRQVDRFRERAADLRTSVEPIVSLTNALLSDTSMHTPPNLEAARSAALNLASGLISLVDTETLEREGWASAAGPTDLADVIGMAAQLAASRWPGRRLTILSPRGALIGFWDARLVSRVLHPLLGHAMARSLPGRSVTVTVTDSVSEVIIGVSDEGPALSAREFQAILTDPMISLAVGLDLNDARRLVEAQGGHIWAHSNTHGTTCYFSLPRQELETGRIAG